MKKLISLLLIGVLCLSLFAGCGDKNEQTAGTDFTVGVCQLMEHPSLDSATKGFEDALKAKMTEAGKTVSVEVQVAGGAEYCTTVANALVAKDVDLIMANATDALIASANASATIPVLGTSVTDYESTFSGNIPANVSGTSDAVPFAEQAQMMIDTLKLAAGDQVGVLYCANESNSLIQYEAVKALFEEKGIVVKAYTFSDITELQSLATTAATESKAIYVPSDNTVAANDSIVGMICNEQKTPVYTSYGGAICYASLAIDYYQLGYRTGEMAAEILLGGKKPADMPVETLTPAVSYNESICAELGIAVPEN